MSEKRLAIVTDVATPSRVPVFNSIAEQLGDRLRVFLMAERGRRRAWVRPLEKARFAYEILPGRPVWGSTRPFPSYLNLGIGRAVRSFRPNVVVIGGYYHPTSFLAGYEAKRLGAKLVLWSESTLRDRRSHTALLGWIKRQIVGACDGFLVPGRASREYLRTYGAKDPRIVTAPNAVDVRFFAGQAASLRREGFRSPSRAGGPVALLFVGRLSPEKGLPVLLEALRRVQLGGLGATLNVVGDGPARGEYEALRARHGLHGVEFLGFRQQTELPAFYVASDLLVVPSVSEPWGLVVNEAMACGLPVICSENVGAAYDLVEDGVTGFICTRVDDYVRVIGACAAHPERLGAIGKAAALRAIEFTPAACAAGFLAVLNE